MASLGEAPEIYTLLGWFELLFLFGTAHRALIWVRDFSGNSNKIDTDLLSLVQNMLSDISPFGHLTVVCGQQRAGEQRRKELVLDNVSHVAIIILYFGIYLVLNRR